MKTLNEQYQLIHNKKGNKSVFLKEARRLYPKLIRNGANFKEVSTILKQKNIINENFVGLNAINNPIEQRIKEPYELAFENFLKEAEVKAEEKKVTKEVEEDQDHAYNNKDKKDPNNMIYGQIQMGVYFEAKQEKNADKTLEEIRDIVYKNLDKDPIYYTKNGQFGVEVGYTDDVPSLGEPEEPKGKYKESGYGDIKGESKFDYVVKENKLKKKKILKEHTHVMAGGIVTGGAWKAPTLAELLGEITEEETNEATAEEQRLIAKWMPFIGQNRDSAMAFSLVVGKQNSRIDRTYLPEVPEDYLDTYVEERDARLEALNDPLAPYEAKVSAKNGLITQDETDGFDVLNLGTEPFTKDEIRAKIN